MPSGIRSTSDKRSPISDFRGGCGRLRAYIYPNLRAVGEFSDLLEDVSGKGKVFARVDRVQVRNLIAAILEDGQRHVGKAFARRGPLPGGVKALYEIWHEPMVYKVGTEEALEFLDRVSNPTDLRRSRVEPPDSARTGLEKHITEHRVQNRHERLAQKL